MDSDDGLSASKDEKILPMFTGTKVWQESHPDRPKNISGLKTPNKMCLIEERDSVKKRHLDGNAKRLKAEAAKRNQQRSNVATVQEALRNIDDLGIRKNKKIIFSNDDKEAVEKLESHALQLFNDDDNEVEEEYSFHIREEFEGFEGQNLLSLQNSYGNDSRFKLDEHFFEDDEYCEHDPEQIPKPNSSKVKVKGKPLKNESKTAMGAEVAKDSSSSYYSVSHNISSLFSRETGQSQFSLLGSQGADIEQEETTEYKQDKWSRTNIKEKPTPRTPSEPQVSQSNPFKAIGWFFINPDDKHLAEECSFFCNREDDEEVQRKWLTNRPIILQTFRRLRREKGKTSNKRSHKKFRDDKTGYVAKPIHRYK